MMGGAGGLVACLACALARSGDAELLLLLLNTCACVQEVGSGRVCEFVVVVAPMHVV